VSLGQPGASFLGRYSQAHALTVASSGDVFPQAFPENFTREG
jgi:hypothetical protein